MPLSSERDRLLRLPDAPTMECLALGGARPQHLALTSKYAKRERVSLAPNASVLPRGVVRASPIVVT